MMRRRDPSVHNLRCTPGQCVVLEKSWPILLDEPNGFPPLYPMYPWWDNDMEVKK